MTLEEAYRLLEYIYTRSQRHDVRKDPQVIEAFRVVVAAHPYARRALIEYWRGMEYKPDLEEPRKLGEVQAAHPLMRRVMRACRRPGW